MATLIIQIPDLPPVEHVLKEDAITIGRLRANTIALEHWSVSQTHAQLARRGGEYFITDLHSTNGTFLNGQSVSESRLHDGDHVKFGEVTGRFHLDAAPAAAPPAAVKPPAAAPVIAPLPAPPATRRKKTFPLVPVLAGAAGVAGVAVAGLLAWKFFFGGATPPAMAPPSRPATAQALAKLPAPEKPAAIAPEPAPVPPPAAPTAVEAPTNQNLTSLIQSLKAGDPVERRRAAAALNVLGPEAQDAVPALREAIKDPDAEVRMWAALSLINNKAYDKATIPILIGVLHHDNAILRQLACLSLALIPYEPAEKAPVVSALLESANKDANAEVRDAALAALKMIAPEAPPAK